MESIFEDIRERDMDFLFMEEFNVNREFTEKLFEKIIPEIYESNNILAKHSIFDEQFGETDIYISFSIKGIDYIFLIENKINAVFQPDQAKRYNLRKENILKNNYEIRVYSVLFAPEKYITTHNESNEFDFSISYENILNYFESKNSVRDIYKSSIVKMAIEQSRRGYNIKENEIVTKFWKNYWTYLHNNYPNIIMKEPNIKPFDADWPLFYFHWLPKKWEIHHKL